MRTAPLRVGIDIASASDVAASIEKFGDRYLQRLFTPGELTECTGQRDRMASRLAARFAAKEAAIKVLRPHGVRPPWTSIDVQTVEGGWSELVLTGEAQAQAESAKLADFSLSMSHDHDLATAVVVAVCAADTTEGIE